MTLFLQLLGIIPIEYSIYYQSPQRSILYKKHWKKGFELSLGLVNLIAM